MAEAVASARIDAWASVAIVAMLGRVFAQLRPRLWVKVCADRLDRWQAEFDIERACSSINAK